METYNDKDNKLTADGLTAISKEYPNLPMWITKMAIELYNKDPDAFQKLNWDKMTDMATTAEELGGGSDVFKEVEAATEFVKGASQLLTHIPPE